jgi:HAD superfamily hydrolase (TIGR01509 family)
MAPTAPSRPPASRWDLVIFDNDGVLVDSELLANDVLASLLSGAGRPTTVEACMERYMGSSIGRMRALADSDGGPPLPADFEDRYHTLVFERFRTELQAVPGVAAVVTGLDIDCCVASSGSHERIALALGTVGLLDAFAGAIFSADDVEHGKPAPDLFLYAAAARRARPERCVVVEDSPAGVAAARAAGMTVLGFARLTPAGRLAGADAVFDDMASLPGLLATVAPAGGS